jgi:hypothetical protein
VRTAAIGEAATKIPAHVHLGVAVLDYTNQVFLDNRDVDSKLLYEPFD